MKLLSGAVHYFRLMPEYWEDCLYNLKAMGFNAVETYIPWNIHEPEEGEFDFSGSRDVAAFVRLAGAMGLHVIDHGLPHLHFRGTAGLHHQRHHYRQVGEPGVRVAGEL